MIIRLLFVHSALANLQRLQHALEPMRGTWEMTFVTSGQEATALLAREACDVLAAELHTPGVEGSSLLAETARRYPSLVRFAFAGAADGDTIINAGELAHEFLSAECGLPEMRTAVERAFALRIILASEPLQALVGRIGTLPGLPELFLQVSREIRAPDPSLQRIGKLLERDPSMSARILRLVNSAFYGLSQPISSPALAVNLLGLQTVESVVLLFDIYQHFDRLTIQAPAFSLAEHQHHSVHVAQFARAIDGHRGVNAARSDEVFMAGLLHDIGKLILAQSFPQQYNAVLEHARAAGLSVAPFELEVFGATHAEVGAYLLSLWGLATPVVAACAFHHAPRATGHMEFTPTTTVHVADGLIHERQATEPGSRYLDRDYLASCVPDDHLAAWELLVPTSAAPLRNAPPTHPAPPPIPRPAAPPPRLSWWARLRHRFFTR